MNVIYKKNFRKQWAKVRYTHLANEIEKLVLIVIDNPFQTPPPYEKLQGLQDTYSRRINKQHRLVYVVEEDTISFASCWGHYE